MAVAEGISWEWADPGLGARLAGAALVQEVLEEEGPEEALSALCRWLEEPGHPGRWAVLAAEGGALRHVAAPGLPEALSQALGEIPSDGEDPPWSRAAAQAEPVDCPDLAEAGGGPHADLLLSHGLEACTVQRVTAPSGALLGAVALYRTEPGPLDPAGAAWLRLAAELAARPLALRALEIGHKAVPDLSPLLEVLHEPTLWLDREGRVRAANSAFHAHFGVKPGTVEGRPVFELGGGAWNAEPLHRLLEAQLEPGTTVQNWELDLMLPDLGPRSLGVNARRLTGGEVLLALEDRTDRLRLGELEQEQGRLLEMMARHEPLEEILEHLMGLLEARLQEGICTLLLATQDRVYHAAGKSLPPELLSAMDGLEAKPGTCTPGACAWRKEAVLTEDIAQDALWERHRDLALPHGLRACWSLPILSGSGELLGVLGVYCRRARKPRPGEMELLQGASRLAAMAMEYHRLTDQLQQQGQHDALTRLPNRGLFEDRLEKAIAQARRYGQHVAVLFLDIDGFQHINDTLGHQVGDALLDRLARRLERVLRKSDTLARMGGDQFMMAVSGLKDPSHATTVAAKCLDTVRMPFEIGTHELYVTATVGIALYPQDALDPDLLLRHADSAMHRAKARGKDSIQYFTPELNARVLEYHELESQLRRALKNRELATWYQPKFSRTGALMGFEALVRWQHPRLGMIPPSKFVPVAEETGMILPIGHWMLEQACRQYVAWRDAGFGNLQMAVNVSTAQFQMEDCVETVQQVLATTGMDPHWLELELTESLIMQNAEEMVEVLARCRELGVRIAIDDFGTGYSSLSYLKRLPVDTLKIDQSFVGDIGPDAKGEPGSGPIVQTIVSLAHNLGLHVVAEGVETRRQVDFLRELGCDVMQGYFFSKPLPAEACEAYLRHELSVMGI